MIYGIGNDIVEIERIENAIKKTGFLEKYFTKSEINFFKEKNYKPQHIASNFSAKEAVVKSMGTGFRGFIPIEIEILRDFKGMPYVNFHGNAKKIIDELQIYNIFVSISHSKHYVTATAVSEKLI